MSYFRPALIICSLGACSLVMARGTEPTKLALAQVRLLDPVLTTTLTTDRTTSFPGERISVRAELQALVPTVPVDADIALVLDASTSMEGRPNLLMRAAVREMVEILDMRRHRKSRVAVIPFSNTATITCPLSNNYAKTIGCIEMVRAKGGTSIDAGIKRGMQTLNVGRPTRAAGFRSVMVVLSDGVNNSGCAPVMAEANRAKGSGVRVFSICLGSACDTACMQDIASSSADFADVRRFDELLPAFAEAGHTMRAEPAVRLATVSVRVPSHLTVDPASIKPSAAIMMDGREVVWTTDRLDRDGNTFSFEAEVTETGFAPLFMSTQLELIDGSVHTPLSTSDPVGDPKAAPTPTATSTPKPTSTSTSEPTPTSRPTAPQQTAAEWFATFLPLVKLNR